MPAPIETFAKLFETPDGQLLVTLEALDSEDRHPMKVRCADVDGIVCELTPSFETERAARAAFDHYDQPTADQMARGMRLGVRNMLARAGA
jgi:hypothetical protein